MEKETIYLIRAGLKQELENYVGNSAKIKLNNKTVEEILFNVDEIGMKTFAFPIELMKKINFEGISFDNFFAFGFDFTGFKGVSLDPQKVFDRDLSYISSSSSGKSVAQLAAWILLSMSLRSRAISSISFCSAATSTVLRILISVLLARCATLLAQLRKSL